MKRLLGVSVLVFTLGACCKAICEDESLRVSAYNLQVADIDTVFLIKYKPGTNFTERIDTVKRNYAQNISSSVQSAGFFDSLDPATDWKIVIPAVNKEYFISNIETGKQRCMCEGGTYREVQKFRFNNTEVEGSSVRLN